MPVEEVRMPTCAVASCDRPVSTRGWCHRHDLRWYRTGDVRAEIPGKGQRVSEKVDHALAIIRRYRPDVLADRCSNCGATGGSPEGI